MSMPQPQLMKFFVFTLQEYSPREIFSEHYSVKHLVNVQNRISLLFSAIHKLVGVVVYSLHIITSQSA